MGRTLEDTVGSIIRTVALGGGKTKARLHLAGAVRHLCLQGNGSVRPGVSSATESVWPLSQFGLSQFGLFHIFSRNFSFYFIVSLIYYFNI